MITWKNREIKYSRFKICGSTYCIVDNHHFQIFQSSSVQMPFWVFLIIKEGMTLRQYTFIKNFVFPFIFPYWLIVILHIYWRYTSGADLWFSVESRFFLMRLESHGMHNLKSTQTLTLQFFPVSTTDTLRAEIQSQRCFIQVTQ